LIYTKYQVVSLQRAALFEAATLSARRGLSFTAMTEFSAEDPEGELPRPPETVGLDSKSAARGQCGAVVA
jgi:hypothetical protein